MSKAVHENKIDVAIIVTDDDINDIMCTALEGGINYWCNAAKVPEDKRVANWGHEQIANGGELKIHVIEPFDEEGTEWYTLDKEKFMKGMKKYIQDPVYDCIVAENGKLFLDVGEIDAVCADSIIQYSLFGEEVYG